MVVERLPVYQILSLNVRERNRLSLLRQSVFSVKPTFVHQKLKFKRTSLSKRARIATPFKLGHQGVVSHVVEIITLFGGLGLLGLLGDLLDLWPRFLFLYLNLPLRLLMHSLQ